MKKIRYLSMMTVLLIGAIIGGHALNPPMPVADDQGTLTLVADPSDGGSVSGGGTFATGSSVSLRASAATGFVFVNWTAADGTIVSETANFTYTKKAGDEVLTAHFKYNPGSPGEPVTPVFPEKKETYALTLISETGGGSPSGSGEYEEGISVRVSVSTDANYNFIGWFDTEADTLVSSVATFDYVMPAKAVTLQAHFKYNPGSPGEPSQPDIPVIQPKHTVTASVSPADGGSVSIDNATLEEGQQTRMRAYAASSFKFIGWYVADTLYGTSADFYYTMGAADITFEARFVYSPSSPNEPDQPDIPIIMPKYNVTVEAQPADAGSVSLNNSVVEEGKTTRLSYSVNSGFVFLGWYVGDSLYSTSNNFDYTMGSSDINFIGRFKYSPGSPSEPSAPDTKKYEIYLTSVSGLPGRTVKYPIYLNALDTLLDMHFNLNFPTGSTPDFANARISGKAVGYTMTYEKIGTVEEEEEESIVAGVKYRSPKMAASSLRDSYAISLTGGKTPPCNTRLLTVDLALSDDFDASEIQQVSVNQISMTNTDGTTEMASAKHGSLEVRESSDSLGVVYYLTATVTGYGTVRIGNKNIRNSVQAADVTEGSSINVYFNPDNGYHVHQVLMDDADVTGLVNSNRLLVDNVTDDIQLEVTFAEGASANYPMTITVSEGGTVTYDGTSISNGRDVFDVPHAAMAAIDITPDAGYHISEVLVNNTNVTDSVINGQLILTSVTESKDISVTFEQTMHEMFLSVSGNGTLIVGDGDSIRNNMMSEIRLIPENAPTTLMLKPDAGNRVDTIYVLDEFDNPLDASTLTTLRNDILIIHDVTQTIMLYVRFVPISHNINISKSGSGQVVIEGAGIGQEYVTDTLQTYYTYNAQISHCEPDDGWHLAQITYNGGDISLDSLNVVLLDLTEDADIHISFEQNMLALDVDVTAGGSVVFNTPFDGTTLRGEIHNEYEVAELSEVSLSFVPDAGYHLVSVLVNGVVADMQGGTTLSIAQLTESTTIMVTFAQNMQGLTIYAYGGGRVIYGSNQVAGDADSISSRNFDVAELSDVTLNFIPNEGYHLESVMVNGTDMTSSVNNNELTLSGIEVSTEIVATFAQSYYILHALAEGNGTLSFMVHPKDSIHGSGDDSAIEQSIRNGGEGYDVPAGATIDFVLTPDSGYHIATLLIDGVDAMSRLDGNTLTIDNISADVDVAVAFEQTMYALTLNASGNGNVVYGDSTLRNKSQYFSVGEFADAVISIVPDAGYHIASVMLNGEDAMSRIDSEGLLALNSVTDATTVAVVFEQTMHQLSVVVEGYGINAIFGETTIESGQFVTFDVAELSNPVIQFESSAVGPYIVGLLTLNGTDVTSQIEQQRFTLPSVERNDTIVVRVVWGGPVMELTAEGSGVMEYLDQTLRDSTDTFFIFYAPVSVNVVPDAEARILKIEKDGIDITADYNTSIGTANRISILSGPVTAQDDVRLHVTFINTYELKVMTMEGDSVKNIHISRLDEGQNDTISIVPDDGWILSGVTVNGDDRTSDVENNMIVIADIREAMNVVVTYERAEFLLSIGVEGRGSVKFVNTGDETTGDTTDSIVVSFAEFPLTFDFTPDFGAELISVVVNNTDMTSQLTVMDDDKMRLVLNSNIMDDCVSLGLKVVYADHSGVIIADGLRFQIMEPGSNRLSLIGVEPAEHIIVPDEVTYRDETYIVVDIDADALSESRGCLITIDFPATIASAASGVFANCQHLSAITWRSGTPLTADMMQGYENSNLLLYIQPEANAANVGNVIDLQSLIAESIKLYDDSGDFYCPTPFVAGTIEYSHDYTQATQTGVCEGWETIVLPFDVETVTHETQGEIHPFATLLDEQIEDGERPFWLYEYHESNSWTEAEGIRANVPYIISMPNEPDLWDIYILGGKVTFSSRNAQVAATADAHCVESAERIFTPSFRNDTEHVRGYYLMNVGDAYDTHLAGSIFSAERDERVAHPFEAYFESTAYRPVKGYMNIFDGGAVDIRSINNGYVKSIEGIFDISGRRIKGEPQAPGIYIVNGKKVFIK